MDHTAQATMLGKLSVANDERSSFTFSPHSFKLGRISRLSFFILAITLRAFGIISFTISEYLESRCK